MEKNTVILDLGHYSLMIEDLNHIKSLNDELNESLEKMRNDEKVLISTRESSYTAYYFTKSESIKELKKLYDILECERNELLGTVEKLKSTNTDFLLTTETIKDQLKTIKSKWWYKLFSKNTKK